MGVGGIGIWQLLIVLVIVLLLFGGSKLRNLGSDIGSAVKGFKKSMTGEEIGKASGNSKKVGTQTKKKTTKRASKPSPRGKSS